MVKEKSILQSDILCITMYYVGGGKGANIVTSIRIDDEDFKNLETIRRYMFLKTGLHMKTSQIIKMCLSKEASYLKIKGNCKLSDI